MERRRLGLLLLWGLWASSVSGIQQKCPGKGCAAVVPAIKSDEPVIDQGTTQSVDAPIGPASSCCIKSPCAPCCKASKGCWVKAGTLPPVPVKIVPEGKLGYGTLEGLKGARRWLNKTDPNYARHLALTVKKLKDAAAKKAKEEKKEAQAKKDDAGISEKKARRLLENCMRMKRDARHRVRLLRVACVRAHSLKSKKECAARIAAIKKEEVKIYKKKCLNDDKRFLWKLAKFDCNHLQKRIISNAHAYRDQCDAMRHRDRADLCYRRYRHTVTRWMRRFERSCKGKKKDPHGFFPKPIKIERHTLSGRGACLSAASKASVPEYVMDLPLPMVQALKKVPTCQPGVSECIPFDWHKFIHRHNTPAALVPLLHKKFCDLHVVKVPFK